MQSQESNLDKYGRKLPPKAGQYHVPSITTDALVVQKAEQNDHNILMITRKNNPFKDFLAFPGGFVDYNEDPLKGCLRELEEETGLKGFDTKLFDVRGEPSRDPRQHIISIFYLVNVDPQAKPIAGDDASKASFFSLNKLIQANENVQLKQNEDDWKRTAESEFPIAFDHLVVLRQLHQHLQQQ